MISHPLTLLIVESSVIADRIRKIAPPYLTVYATEGYLWNPLFDKKRLKLRKKADPGKVSLRKEIKEQAQWASKIIIATDSDPSGEFIACTLANYLKNCSVFRTYLNSISPASIEKSVDNAEPFEPQRLFKALETKYLIRYYWKQFHPDLSITEAGLIVLFGTDQSFRTFISENGSLFKSDAPIQISLDKKLSICPAPERKNWIDILPPSTFDIIPLVQSTLQTKTFSEAQTLLNRLFYHLEPNSGAGLITYPRTAENRFYSDSWQRMQDQWIHFENLDRFRNTSLRDPLENDAPHEAIHPTDLRLKPDKIGKSIPKELADVYDLIYRKTVAAITNPKMERQVFASNVYTENTFTSVEHLSAEHKFLRPVITVPQLGATLEDLGVLKASGFGTFIDRALKNNLIQIQKGSVSAGLTLTKFTKDAEKLKLQLSRLKRFSTSSNYSVETLREIFTSYA